MKYKGGFIQLEHYFNWSAFGDQEIVMRIKAELLKEEFVKVIYKLIEEDKYELLDKILRWCLVMIERK